MKKLLLFLLALVPLAAIAATADCFNGPTWYDYRNTALDISDKGTYNNPIVIQSGEDLAQIAWLVNEQHNTLKNKVISLAADIDLKKEVNGKRVSWIPIGFDDDYPFEGIFLGCGTETLKRHTIKGMYIDVLSWDNYFGVGLFGVVRAFIGYFNMTEAEIKVSGKGSNSFGTGLVAGRTSSSDTYHNINTVCLESDGGNLNTLSRGIYSVSVEGQISTSGSCLYLRIGGIVGIGNVSVCHSTAKVTIRTNGDCASVGGITGSQTGDVQMDPSSIIDCAAEVDIKATAGGIGTLGGIAGHLTGTDVMGCSATGIMENTIDISSYLANSVGCGGIVGMGYTQSLIKGCTSSVTMKAKGWIGGIIGGTDEHPDKNPYIDCCFASGHIDASLASGAGGIVGICNPHAGQLVNSCIFAGTIDHPANSKTCGAILGKTDNAEEDAAQCYYDSQLYTGQAAGGITKHNTILALPTADLTSGVQSKTPLLTIDEGNFGFTLKEAYYPAVYCKSQWDGYTTMTKNKFNSESARKLLGSDMTTANSIAVPGQWLATLPAILKRFDYSTDFVSTLTFHAASNTWEDKAAGINFNMIASMQDPKFSFTSLNGDELSAVKEGTGIVTFQVKSKDKATSVTRPAAPDATRQMRIISTIGGVWDGTIGTSCASGTGKAEDPFIIKNGAQLAYAVINNKQYEFYEQVCDITLFKNRHDDKGIPNTSQNIWMDSKWPDKYISWYANYDGTGHFIKGACINKLQGLFGDIESTGTVSNLGIIDSYARRTAGLFARYMDGTITNCIAQGTVGEPDRGFFVGPESNSGGFCGIVGYKNANAYIEDCISGVSSGIYTFADFTPFVSLDNNKGQVRNCLAVVPFSHLDKDYKNSGITASGKSYIKDCYWLKGYEEANSGQTLDEISQKLGSRKLWEATPGYLPTLKTFAETDMAKLMMVPFRTDVNYAYDAQKQESDNYLLGIGHQIVFEPGAAVWSAVNDQSSTYLETDTDMGVVVPVKASYDDDPATFFNEGRKLPGLVFVTGSLGDAKFPVPVRTRRGNVNAGFTFEDENARQACLSAFDTDHNNVISLAELKAVTNEQTLTAFQTETARRIKNFPEFRFFKSVTLLTSQLNDLSNLESVQLPHALQTIGKEAFKGCTNLKQVTISSKVASVQGGAFYGSEVDSIFVDPFNTTFTSRDGVLFTKANGLVAYPNGRKETEATIAGTVSSIASGAFYQVPNLTKIFFDTFDYTTIPELAEGALVIDESDPFRPDLMDVYVSDATYDHVLMNEYIDNPSWKPYVDAGKLHQYFPLKITKEAGVIYPGSTGGGHIGFEHYVGTLYIGFATELPKELKAYTINAFKELEYKAYYYQKTQLVPALQPVIIMTTEPGTYRLTPVEGNLERWPVYANSLIGVGRDGMQVNQSTSEQGSIMTLQKNEDGFAAFLYEKKKEIEPYKCYLPFPTIDRPAEVVRNAHYDLVFAEQANYESTTEGDYDFKVETLLPDNQRYARLVRYNGPGGDLKVPGKLKDGTPVTQLGEHVFENARTSIRSIDMTEMDNLEAFDGDRYDGSKPLGHLSDMVYVYLNGDKCNPGVNTILNDKCSELKLLDGRDFYAPFDFQADKVTYDRVLSATKNADGTWTSKAYTICLPYDVHFEGDENITFYELEAVNDKYEFVFINCFNFINAGVPAVVVVKEGEYHLNMNNVKVIGEPSEEINSTVYDTFEGSQDLTGTQVGDWRGTFRKIDNEEGSSRHVFGMYGEKWKIIRNDTEAYRTGYIPPFRAFYEPLEFIGNWVYTAKLVYTENGEYDDPTPQDFPAGSYDSDLPNYGDGDPVGINPVIHTIDRDGADQYYDLQGRLLNGKPNKGIYIYKGKKIKN